MGTRPSQDKTRQDLFHSVRHERDTQSDTGLPTFEILKETFDFVGPHSTRRSSLTEIETGN